MIEKSSLTQENLLEIVQGIRRITLLPEIISNEQALSMAIKLKSITDSELIIDIDIGIEMITAYA